MIHVPGDHTTIGAAIAAADSGATIKINPGTYYETLSMKSGVNLASNYGTVTIYPSGSLNAVARFSGVHDISVEGINFSGLLINAVEITNSDDITLRYCDFKLANRIDGAAGLYVSGASSDVALDQCSFHHAGYGLNASGSLVTSVSNPTGPIVDTRDGEIDGKSRFYNNLYGIYLTQNGNISVPHNNFSYPSPHNSTNDIYARADVHLNINALGCFWGYQDGSDSLLRAPDVQHDGRYSHNPDLAYSIVTGNAELQPVAKPVADPVPDRKRVASDLVKDAMELLFAGKEDEAKAGFKLIFETYGDLKEEAIAALYVLVAASSKLDEGDLQKSELMEFARTHTSPEIRAASAYLAIGLVHNAGHVDSALAKMAEFERDHAGSSLRPDLLLDKALLLEHRGEESKAKEVFKQLAQTYPTWGQAALVRSKLQAREISLPSAKGAARELSAGVAPNPFNSSTTLRFQVPESGKVSLVIYNVAGQVVKRVLEKQYLEAGHHSFVWDGLDAEGRRVASGVYLYRLSAGKQAVVRKMTLLR